MGKEDEIAAGFDYSDPSIIYNQSTNFVEKYSEIDFTSFFMNNNF